MKMVLLYFFSYPVYKEFVMFLMYLKLMLVIRIVSQFSSISFIDAEQHFWEMLKEAYVTVF